VTRFSLQGGWLVEILTAAVSHSDGQGKLRRRTSLRSRLMLSCRSFISNRISLVGLHWSQSYSKFRNREFSVLGLPFTSIPWSPVSFLCPSGEPMFCQLSLFCAIKWIWKEAFLDLLSTDLPGRRKNHENPPPLWPLPGPRLQQKMHRIQSRKASTYLSTTIFGYLKCVYVGVRALLSVKKSPPAAASRIHT